MKNNAEGKITLLVSAVIFMRLLLIIPALILAVSFSAKANMDCVYTSHQAGITVRIISPCTGKYQQFLDSFVNQLVQKINRTDTSGKILVLINLEFLYYGFSGSPDYFTSIGVDTLREMNSDYINRYCYARYSNTDQSRATPLNINATNEKQVSTKVGVKIIYNFNYRNTIDWGEVEKLIRYAAFEFNTIKSAQQFDTVRHYSWYVYLPTLDTIKINQIIGRKHTPSPKTAEVKKLKGGSMAYKPVLITAIGLFLLAAVYKLRSKKSR